MAHANNSLITGKFRGSLGKQLVFREWAGKTIVAKSPKQRTGKLTPAQEQTKVRFLLATKYAKAVFANSDQSMAEAYARALKPRQNVYARAVADFMSSPVVKSIDARKYAGAIGDSLIIRAVDDFRVTNVRVEIYSPDHQLLEAGDAVQNINGIDWTYTSTKANSPLGGTSIKAIATDVPGNEGVLEITL